MGTPPARPCEQRISYVVKLPCHPHLARTRRRASQGPCTALVRVAGIASIITCQRYLLTHIPIGPQEIGQIGELDVAVAIHVAVGSARAAGHAVMPQQHH